MGMSGHTVNTAVRLGSEKSLTWVMGAGGAWYSSEMFHYKKTKENMEGG